MAHATLDPAGEAGFGIAAWALITMLMGNLRTQGLLSQEFGAVIIDQALHLVEGIDETFQSEAFRHARVQLEQAMRDWHAASPLSQQPPPAS